MANPARDRETTQLRLRMEPQLLKRLQDVADANGTTLAAEIIGRLAQSFELDEVISAIQISQEQMQELSARVSALSSSRFRVLWLIIQARLEAIEEVTGKQWDSNPETLAMSRKAVTDALESLASLREEVDTAARRVLAEKEEKSEQPARSPLIK
ncbi:MAG: hypothetical protein GEU95_11215 [Rhizobiales bacterium]|nr:hypothetical protein [Hyphomicrobiales bacterium]